MADAGDVITFAVSVQNTGNVTLSSLSVSDPMAAGGTLSCTPTTLTPGATASCNSYTHTVTQAEVDAGNAITNTASASANDPGNNAVTGSGSTTTNVVSRNPVIGIAKQASVVTDNGNGSYTTTITLVLENLGNVTLTNVQAVDNLSNVFTAPASFSVYNIQTTGGLTINNNYNGSYDSNLLSGNDTLALGATATVSFDVIFMPNGVNGPFHNSATATAQGPGGASATDISDNGADPDPDGDGNPGGPGENNPTPIDYRNGNAAAAPIPTLGHGALALLMLMLLGLVVTRRRLIG